MATKYNGKVYETWDALREQLKTDGKSPADWVREHPAAAEKLGLGFGPDGKVINVRERDQKIADAKAAVDAAKDLSAEGQYVEWVDAHLKKIGISDQEFIDRMKALKPKNEDDLTLDMIADPWFQATFPGFDPLVKSGQIDPLDFGGYRRYRTGVKEQFRMTFGREMGDDEFNDVAARGLSSEFLGRYWTFTDTVRQHFLDHNGRAATSEEIQDLFKSGKTAERIKQEFQSRDFLTVNRQGIQSTAGAFNFGEGGAGAGQFSEEELVSGANQTAGIDSALGQDVLRRVDLANKRMARIFQGQAAQGALALPQQATRGAPGSRVDVGA